MGLREEPSMESSLESSPLWETSKESSERSRPLKVESVALNNPFPEPNPNPLKRGWDGGGVVECSDWSLSGAQTGGREERREKEKKKR
jgi:hypothetical protein